MPREGGRPWQPLTCLESVDGVPYVAIHDVAAMLLDLADDLAASEYVPTAEQLCRSITAALAAFPDSDS